MIKYHGMPMSGPRSDVARFLRGRHALVSYAHPDEIAIVAEVCDSFVLDNGAFSIWRAGGTLDVEGYTRWCRLWCKHPGFDFALIPDIIDGDEQSNDALLAEWPADIPGAPIWHLHETLDRLLRLTKSHRIVAMGSSGQWRTPGTAAWWDRMTAAMDYICDEYGMPPCKLHGLRMLSTKIFPRLPLASADSVNASMNAGSVKRFGMYVPPTAAQRAEVIAARIEAHNSAPFWQRRGPTQKQLAEMLAI